jgi:hypothetical protein
LNCRGEEGDQEKYTRRTAFFEGGHFQRVYLRWSIFCILRPLTVNGDRQSKTRRATVSDFIDRLVPIPEAAHALGVADRTIRWWIQIGKITVHKLGQPGAKGARVCVPLSEINRIIRESRIPARPEFLAEAGDQSLATTAPAHACGD